MAKKSVITPAHYQLKAATQIHTHYLLTTINKSNLSVLSMVLISRRYSGLKKSRITTFVYCGGLVILS